MEPNENTKEEVKTNKPTEKPKHNNLLIILIIIIMAAIVLAGYLLYNQANTENNPVESTNINQTTTDTTTSEGQVSTDALDNPVSTDIDTEVSNLDASINSQNDSDFSSSGLEDTSLGL